MPGSTEDLITRLASVAKPVKRLPRPARRLALWLAAAASYLVAMSAAAAPEGLSNAAGPFIWQEVAACVVALAAAYGAVLSVVPGRRVRGVVLVAAGATAMWLAILTVASIAEARTLGTIGGLAHETDWPCVVSMVIGGGALAAVMLGLLKRGAPVAPRQSVILGATAAAAVGSIEACLSRPHTFVSTILIWHGTTAAVLLLVLGANARRFLAWRQSPSV